MVPENPAYLVYLSVDRPNLEWPEVIGSRETIQRVGWPLLILCSGPEDASQLSEELNRIPGYYATTGVPMFPVGPLNSTNY